MRRLSNTPRTGWVNKVEQLGFLYHSLDSIYWDERACYALRMNEVLQLERATAELHKMCLEAAQYIIDRKLYARLAIDPRFIPLIERSWDEDWPSIYGRFDFAYDGINAPKMLEYNADTPTSLLEASVIQWYWLQDFDSNKDQFNSIHEKLIEYWKYLKPYLHKGGLHFSAIQGSVEDAITTQYLRDTAEQAGHDTDFIDIAEVGWDAANAEWVDEQDRLIVNMFKLYPWEWLAKEEFAENLLNPKSNTYWIEPPFKMLLSNKGLLPILWEMFPDNPYLLPSFFEDDPRKKSIANNCVIKPLLSREGANIKIISGETTEITSGDYGKEGVIYQQFSPLPSHGGNFPVIGSWVIGQEPAGIGIREGDSLITTNKSRFVPHYIE